jgi:hypothetical protein
MYIVYSILFDITEFLNKVAWSSIAFYTNMKFRFMFIPTNSILLMHKGDKKER